jgi:F-type H+-transporting ATPase subunit b
MSQPYLAAEGAPNPLLPEWSEIILVLIVFAILWFLVARFVVPAIEKAYAARRNEIEGGIERARQAQEEAQRTLAEYQQQLAEARTEAAQIRESARAEAQHIVEDLRTQAQEESARIIARGEETLAQQRQQIVRELRGEIGTLAVDLAGRIVDQRLADDAAVQRTVDDFLAGLEGGEAAGLAGR